MLTEGFMYNILQVRLRLVNTVQIASQQLNAGESTIGQLLLNLINCGLLQLEAVAAAHREELGTRGTQTREVIGIGVGQDLRLDQEVGLFTLLMRNSNDRACQSEAAHQSLE
jgi:hypothetical protein